MILEQLSYIATIHYFSSLLQLLLSFLREWEAILEEVVFVRLIMILIVMRTSMAMREKMTRTAW